MNIKIDPKTNRREFIKQSGLLSGGLLLPFNSNPAKSPAKTRADKTDLIFNLLKTYCDSMLRLQITELKDPAVYGGVMCPLNVRVRGRIHEAVYPMLTMAKKTGEEKYLQAARLLFRWSENVSNSDGSWRSEPQKSWYGTTVFGVMAWAEAIYRHGDLLDQAEKSKYLERLRSATEFVYRVMDYEGPGNINYPLSSAATLALTGKLFNEKKYSEKAQYLARNAENYLTENKLIFGEGNPRQAKSGKGLLPVDLAYNVEESLVNLVLYYKITGDKEIKSWLVDSLRAHLDFMLPDGCWDNSWGTRNYKWCYFGTRTADGCYPAYFLMADEDPVFATAAKKNLQLIEACTHNGLLHGGLHHHQQGLFPSIHHTFTRAKALATCVDYEVAIKNEYNDKIPREKEYGVKQYPELASFLISKNSWKATVTAYDWWYKPVTHASGGAISMLWHNQLGPVLTASLNEYQEVEPANMELNRMNTEICLTPRLQVNQGRNQYMSCNDLNADLKKVSEDGSEIKLNAKGTVVNGNQESPESGIIKHETQYTINESGVRIEVNANFKADQEVLFYLPVVSVKGETYQLAEKSVSVSKSKGKLLVQANRALLKYFAEDRIYNPVPGLQALPLYFTLESNQPLIIDIQYQA